LPQVKIFKEDWEVDSRLGFFGVTRDELMTVVEMAVGARADAVPHDPVTAPGTFSYIYGTRALRDVFVPKGWVKNSTEGIESIYDSETGTKVIFQNTDSACDICHPKAISGKGLASERVVMDAAKGLFPEIDEERRKRLNGPVWYFCLSANGDDVRAELSRPLAIKRGQFSEFIERIFILKHGEWNPITPSKMDDYPLFQDFDIPVTRK
jgi:hypothetical protein